MPGAAMSFVVAKGEAVTFTGTHQKSAIDATPVDISGWGILVTVKDRLGATIFSKPGDVTNGPLGQYSWSVVHADTNIVAASYDVDIWRTDAGSEREMDIGVFSVVGDVLYGS